MMLNRFEPNEKLKINSNNMMSILSSLFNLEDCQNTELFQLRVERFKQELLSGGACIYRFTCNDTPLPSNIRASLNIISEIRTPQEEYMFWRLATFFRSNNYIVEFSSSNYCHVNLYDKENAMKYVSSQSIRFYNDHLKAVLSDVFNGCRYIWIFPKLLEEQDIFLICINDNFSTLL